jgi:hypothetical protein
MLGIGYAGMPMPIEKQEDSKGEETTVKRSQRMLLKITIH